MPVNIPYKSFCWGLGTTSFRTKNFNKTIEKQLDLLNDFWNIHNENFEVWAGNSFLQEQYYDFMICAAFSTVSISPKVSSSVLPAP